MKIRTSLKELTIKERISYIFATLAFIIGWALTIAGFIVPPTGEISGSVLWVLGQALLFAGSVIGISEHYGAELDKIKEQLGVK